MPYTEKELETLDFYQSKIKKLRDDYLENIKKSKSRNFRNNNILVSFEDIESGEGLEKINVNNPIYRSLGLSKSDLKNCKTIQNNQNPIYVKTELLEKIIDRNISELSLSKFIDELPENILNGDVVTSEDFDDPNIFLIENNQKRLFGNLGIFYASHSINDIKPLSIIQLESIPDGEIIE